MNPDPWLAATLGLPPRFSAGGAVTAVALRVPLVLGTPSGAARSPSEAAGARAGATPAEVAAILQALLPEAALRERPGRLPILATTSGLTAPGVPVLARSAPADGPDGPYRARDGAIERERAGIWEPFDRDLPVQGPDRTLLLFTPEARWLVSGDRIVVEDPFCRVRTPLVHRRAEALLVRRLRFAPEILEGFDEAGPAEPTGELEVARHATLLPAASWESPEGLFAVREGVERVRREGSRLELVLVTGDRAAFEIEERAGGWRAVRREGEYPALEAWVAADGELVRYGWRLDPRLDPLDAGVRARIAFDLTSDLIRLGEAR